MGSKKSFIKNSLLFMLGSGLSKALGIIMLPLYTSQIPTEDYGAYDIRLHTSNFGLPSYVLCMIAQTEIVRQQLFDLVYICYYARR